jgi:hypothetical protein
MHIFCKLQQNAHPIKIGDVSFCEEIGKYCFLFERSFGIGVPTKVTKLIISLLRFAF